MTREAELKGETPTPGRVTGEKPPPAACSPRKKALSTRSLSLIHPDTFTHTQHSHQVSRGPDLCQGSGDGWSLRTLSLAIKAAPYVGKLTRSKQSLQQALSSGLHSTWQTGCIPMSAEMQLIIDLCAKWALINQYEADAADKQCVSSGGTACVNDSIQIGIKGNSASIWLKKPNTVRICSSSFCANLLLLSHSVDKHRWSTFLSLWLCAGPGGHRVD